MSVAYALLFYVAAAVFLGGLGFRIWTYARAPAPLKIPTTPAPTDAKGAAVRILREVVLFESLFRANKWTWLLGWSFHAALVLILVRHLRYFTEPVWSWVALAQPFGLYAAFVFVVALAGLWLQRFRVERIRYISGASDHLMLLLLLTIGVSGLALKYVARTDVVQLKAFALGLVRFEVQPLPAEPLLLIHLGLVALLMIVFPFSKLLHAPGVFFSPTRNQVDDPREKRHVTPWAAPRGAAE